MVARASERVRGCLRSSEPSSRVAPETRDEKITREGRGGDAPSILPSTRSTAPEQPEHIMATLSTIVSLILSVGTRASGCAASRGPNCQVPRGRSPGQGAVVAKVGRANWHQVVEESTASSSIRRDAFRATWQKRHLKRPLGSWLYPGAGREREG